MTGYSGFSGSAIATAVDKQTITNRIEDPNLVTDPKELAISQEMISDYNLYVSMVSTLTRKGVGAVETLLRSWFVDIYIPFCW